MEVDSMRARTLSQLTAASLLVLLASAGPAPAFYWKGWPGSLLPPDRVLVPPGDSVIPGSPPLPGANPILPPGGEIPPPEPGGPVPPSENVPEPATALLGLLGIGGIAATRWVRARQLKPQPVAGG
jgi:hypothetical protein